MARLPSLIPEQRRQEILRHLQREQVLSYKQLTELVGVSHMTVRRDVAALAEQGWVTAAQGGALFVPRQLAEPRRMQKNDSDLPQRTAIAKAAASMVSDSMTIYLDAGTTVQAMRPFLEARTGLTIVSNDLSTILAFMDHRGVDIVCLGGSVDINSQSTLGRLAARTLKELSLDIAFLSCQSWDAKHGVTAMVEAAVEVKRAAHDAATSTVLLADSGKFARFGTYRVISLEELDRIVTDDGLSVDDLDVLPTEVTEVIRADAIDASPVTATETVW
ncbi:DeoR/GlpR family DNA-binding transcription regulator [Arthrobacter sp. ZGTC412]|uniref:DeoR/GlpR family DNA-binding transcription regulator n=1 Tax=Arthrobacter sp. ZGTC412 TaxID=2058900 RepID=UPI000CE439D0|nr:DeoR/GlpR family DNA-binding transcription regulator [Arthrobacter sp. ZGTC412]